MSARTGRGLDWPALMRLGLGRLRLPPASFWSMTPVELRAAAEGAFGAAGERFDPAALRRLIGNDASKDHGAER